MGKDKELREIVFDTETTGLNINGEDRIVEIACIELLNHIPTGKIFHVYINPERKVPEEVVRVHGLDNKFLDDKPKFAEIANDFIKFIGDATLIAHNAKFDISMLNVEFRRLNLPELELDRVVDTVQLSHQVNHHLFRHNIETLCEYYGIDASTLETHNILFDVQLLAEIYLNLLGKNNKKDGIHKEYYKNGNIHQEKIVKNGKLNGICKTYYETGIIKSEWNYKDGNMDGNWKYYFPNGILAIEKIYENNICKRIYKHWENGNLKSMESYDDNNYEPNGLCKYYYENGNIKTEGVYKTYDYFLEKDGLHKEYWENGNILSEMFYTKGILNGVFREYYDNGNLFCEYYYKNGQVDYSKKRKIYTENGDLVKTGTDLILGFWQTFKLYDFLHGDLDEYELIEKNSLEKNGIYKEYYGNGNIKSEYNFIHGKKYGWEKLYYENGKLADETYYKYNLSTTWNSYTKTGKLKVSGSSQYTREYTKTIILTYYENGMKKYEWNYKNSKRDGIQKYYDKNGKLKYSRNYKDGKWIREK